MTNILKAIVNVIDNPNFVNLNEMYVSTGNNRANNMGDALESYVKDLFSNTFDIQDHSEKLRIYQENFSYFGSKNHPPDMIIRNGDAIEVKKIEKMKSGIPLNSSYPKDKIFSTSPMITQACRDCEVWQEKDIIYIIGTVQSGIIKALWFVYGNCYAANNDIYESVKRSITEGINGFQEENPAETKEIGRVNDVDPLRITFLRIRGMWQIKNPIHVFNYITTIDQEANLTLNTIMLKEKYDSFPEADREILESKVDESDLTISDVEIQSPNNPAQLLQAKLIKYVL